MSYGYFDLPRIKKHEKDEMQRNFHYLFGAKLEFASCWKIYNLKKFLSILIVQKGFDLWSDGVQERLDLFGYNTWGGKG